MDIKRRASHRRPPLQSQAYDRACTGLCCVITRLQISVATGWLWTMLCALPFVISRRWAVPG